MASPKSAINPSLQKKTAARMAAVQCAYTALVTGDIQLPQQQVALLKKRLANNRDEQKLVVGSPIEPDYKLAESLLAARSQHGAEIDGRIDGVLGEGWKRQRLSPLLLAILQCAVAEMFFAREIKLPIAIDEYTRLTRHFFTDDEVGFVHGALSKLAEQYG